MYITLIWMDNLKGIGEGFDSDGVIQFINMHNQDSSILFPNPNDVIYLINKAGALCLH